MEEKIDKICQKVEPNAKGMGKGKDKEIRGLVHEDQ